MPTITITQGHQSIFITQTIIAVFPMLLTPQREYIIAPSFQQTDNIPKFKLWIETNCCLLCRFRLCHFLNTFRQLKTVQNPLVVCCHFCAGAFSVDFGEKHFHVPRKQTLVAGGWRGRTSMRCRPQNGAVFELKFTKRFSWPLTSGSLTNPS